MQKGVYPVFFSLHVWLAGCPGWRFAGVDVGDTGNLLVMLWTADPFLVIHGVGLCRVGILSCT